MKILMVSLGCDKNLCDSEAMLGKLHSAGHEITNDEQEAEVVVINTCAFIKDAKQESINTIIEMAELKKTAHLKKLIVAGCLSQRYQDEIMEELPEIDVILGSTNFDKILDAIGTDDTKIIDSINYMPDTDNDRIVTTLAGMAYLKIAEGCGKMCTYCVIPYIRGKYRSVPMEKLLSQAEMLAENGVKELILVAQETTLYGTDIYGKKMLPELLRKLCDIDGIEWIRLMYCYPEEITEELIDVMADCDKICKYIDIPIQHSEDNILKRMGRRTNRKELVDLITTLRNRIPDIAIRTTLITGFPGETREEHESVCEFINDMEFDRLGVFTYSPEEGTPAASFKDQVPEDIAEGWRNEIMELQQEMSYDRNQSFVGRRLKVLIEGYLDDGDVYIGRSYRDAPSVDGMIFVHADHELISGAFVDVDITEANEYDLIGDVAE